MKKYKPHIVIIGERHILHRFNILMDIIIDLAILKRKGIPQEKINPHLDVLNKYLDILKANCDEEIKYLEKYKNAQIFTEKPADGMEFRDAIHDKDWEYLLNSVYECKELNSSWETCCQKVKGVWDSFIDYAKRYDKTESLEFRTLQKIGYKMDEQLYLRKYGRSTEDLGSKVMDYINMILREGPASLRLLLKAKNKETLIICGEYHVEVYSAILKKCGCRIETKMFEIENFGDDIEDVIKKMEELCKNYNINVKELRYLSIFLSKKWLLHYG